MRRKKRFSIENDYLIFDGMNNEIFFKKNSSRIKLTEKQYVFFSLLLKNKCSQQTIIKSLWGDNNIERKSNYYQIIYQCRKLLINNRISKDFIMSVPNYGIRLNYNIFNLVLSH